MIYLVFALIIVCIFIKNYSLKHVLDNLTYTVSASKSVVDQSEDFFLESTIINDKWMPVSYLRVSEIVPSEMVIKATDYVREKNTTHLTSSTYLMPHQTLKRTYTASFEKRGRFFLRGATLYGGDVFGLSETFEYVSLAQEIVVLPKSMGDEDLDNVLGGFLGDISVNRFITPDPILTIGAREYTGNEPMKHINWASSLKLCRLMVKNFDYTTSESVTVILNVKCGEKSQFADSERIEAAFSSARYVCQVLENKHIKYRFVTNATSAGAYGHWNAVPEGLGFRHFYNICEGLGRATYESTKDCATLLYEVAKNAESGRGHIIVSPQMNEQSIAAHNRLKAATNAPCIIVSSDKYAVNEQAEDMESA